VNKTLEEISTISTGFSFRGSIPQDPNGDTRVVQATNLLGNGSITDESDLKRIKVIGRADSVTVSKGDVLLVSRGTLSGGFKAAFVNETRFRLIASSSLHIIRVNHDSVLPEFVCAYLNTPKGQQQLQRIASGSTIRTLLTKNLSLLEIPIPSIETQRTIVELVRNITSQQKLLQQRNSLLNELISSIVIKKSE
jgi:restriction endonuclease S subunit